MSGNPENKSDSDAKKCCNAPIVAADASGDKADSDADKSGNEDAENVEEFGQIEISENDINAYELDFQHCKIPKIENLEALTRIEILGLRWNFIKKIENLSFLTTLHLEHS